MLMYHKNSKEPVDVHPSQIENAKARGWTEKPTSPKPKKDEVNANG